MAIEKLVAVGTFGARLIHYVVDRLLLLENRVLHQDFEGGLLFPGFEEIEEAHIVRRIICFRSVVNARKRLVSSLRC